MLSKKDKNHGKTFFYRKIIVTLHDYISGLTGFDGEMKWYVSTRRFGCFLPNQSNQRINWRKQLRSRCLIEA